MLLASSNVTGPNSQGDPVIWRTAKVTVLIHVLLLLQVIEGVLLKYDQGHDGAVVFEDYEKALHGLLEAYRAPWNVEALQMPIQDTTALMQVKRIAELQAHTATVHSAIT